MDLEVKDVADLLSVSEETIQRWVVEGKIPAHFVNERHLFDRFEVENWMLGENPHLPSIEERTAPSRGGFQHFNFYRAVHKGEVFADIPGEKKEEIIRETMHRVAPKLGLDEDVLTDLLLDREALMPTAINSGIAVPHTRDSLLKSPFDLVIVVYPKKPIEYGALDGQPVHTLFFLLSTSDKKHLQLLAKVAHMSSQEAALDLLRCRPSKEVLLDFIRDWEAQIASPPL